MSISDSRLAYSDCYEVFDLAMEDENGARVKFVAYDDAVFFRMRLHKARNIDRRDNKVTYAPDDPLYGRSVYDKFTVRLRQIDGDFFVYVENNTLAPGMLEKLSELPESEQSTMALDRVEFETSRPPEVRPAHQIEGPVRRRV